MDDVSIRFPVTCPLCGDESLDCRRFTELVDAFFRLTPFELFAPCHGAHWTASALEFEQIREYAGAALLGVSGGRHAVRQPAMDNQVLQAFQPTPSPHRVGALP